MTAKDCYVWLGMALLEKFPVAHVMSHRVGTVVFNSFSLVGSTRSLLLGCGGWRPQSFVGLHWLGPSSGESSGSPRGAQLRQKEVCVEKVLSEMLASVNMKGNKPKPKSQTAVTHRL